MSLSVPDNLLTENSIVFHLSNNRLPSAGRLNQPGKEKQFQILKIR